MAPDPSRQSHAPPQSNAGRLRAATPDSHSRPAAATAIAIHCASSAHLPGLVAQRAAPPGRALGYTGYTTVR